MQPHQWRALGAVGTGLLGAASLILIARNRSSEAYGLALFLSVTGTITSAISHLNAGVPEQQQLPLPQPPPEPMQRYGRWV